MIGGFFTGCGLMVGGVGGGGDCFGVGANLGGDTSGAGVLILLGVPLDLAMVFLG